MSLGSEIKLVFTDGKLFLSKTEAEFVKLFKASPTALQDATNFVNFSAPIVIAIETVAAPELAPESAAVIAIIKADLATLSAAAQSISTASTAEQAMTNLAANLPQLLVASEIKDPATQAKITGYVNLITGELNALIPVFKAWVANLKTPAQTTAPAPAPAQ